MLVKWFGLLLFIFFFTVRVFAVDLTGSWEAKTQGMTGVADITGIAVFPSDWNSLYVLTSAGVYKSTDGGATWVQKNTGLPAKLYVNYNYLYENLLAIDPTNPNILYAAFSGKVYRTTNGGDSWSEMSQGTTVNCPAGGTNSNIVGILIDKANHNHLWVATIVSGCSGGLFEISDVTRSQQWVNIAGDLIPGSGYNDNDMWELTQNPVRTNELYTATVHGVVAKSRDGGHTWTTIAPSPFYDTNGSFIRVHPTQPDTLLLSYGPRVYRSTDDGAHWSVVPALAGLTSDIQFSPTSPNSVYAITTSGLYRSTDGGVTWNSNGHVNDALNSIRVHPSDPNKLYISSYARGLFGSTDGGQTITLKSTNIPASIAVSNIGFHPTNPSVMYATVGSQGIYKSENGGNTWSIYTVNPSIGNAFQFVIDQKNPSVWYTVGETIDKSTDGGLSWSPVFKIEGANFRAVAISPVDSNIVYASDGVGNKIYKSTDGGQNWSVNAPQLNGDSFAFHPTNKDIVFVTSLYGIFKTYDGGVHWYNYYPDRKSVFGEGWAGERFETVSVNPRNGNQVFAANRTNKGFISDDGGNTWTAVINGTSLVGKATFSTYHDNLFYVSDGNHVYQVTKQGTTYSSQEIPKANVGFLKAKYVGILEDPTDPNALWATDGSIYKYSTGPIGGGGGDMVVAAAADIACGPDSTGALCKEKVTSDLVGSINPSLVLIPGDVQYEQGQLSYFNGTDLYCGVNHCYGPTWGRFKSITHVVPGNHEYYTAGARDYFTYFGSAAGEPSKGYYSFNSGDWHFIGINSNCDQIGGCGSQSAQYTWLQQDLASNTKECTVAYWHHPRFTSGTHHGDSSGMQDMWQLLYQNKIDIVLNGHEHNYERFAPMNAQGQRDDALGIREFVIGMGGHDFHAFPQNVKSTSETHNDNTFGILKLVLKPTSYTWQFIPEPGKTFADSGSGTCHGKQTLAGDINDDCVVNVLDYDILFEQFGKNPLTDTRADLNHDGTVNILDYSILFENFGRSCP